MEAAQKAAAAEKANALEAAQKAAAAEKANALEAAQKAADAEKANALEAAQKAADAAQAKALEDAKKAATDELAAKQEELVAARQTTVTAKAELNQKINALNQQLENITSATLTGDDAAMAASRAKDQTIATLTEEKQSLEKVKEDLQGQLQKLQDQLAPTTLAAPMPPATVFPELPQPLDTGAAGAPLSPSPAAPETSTVTVGVDTTASLRVPSDTAGSDTSPPPGTTTTPTESTTAIRKRVRDTELENPDFTQSDKEDFVLKYTQKWKNIQNITLDQTPTLASQVEANEKIISELEKMLFSDNAVLPVYVDAWINNNLKSIGKTTLPMQSDAEKVIAGMKSYFDGMTQSDVAATIYYQLSRLRENNKIDETNISRLKVCKNAPEDPATGQQTEFLVISDDTNAENYNSRLENLILISRFLNAYGFKDINSDKSTIFHALKKAIENKYVSKILNHLFGWQLHTITDEESLQEFTLKLKQQARKESNTSPNTVVNQSHSNFSSVLPGFVCTSNAPYVPLPAYDTACAHDAPVMQYVPLVHTNAHFSTGYMY